MLGRVQSPPALLSAIRATLSCWGSLPGDIRVMMSAAHEAAWVYCLPTERTGTCLLDGLAAARQ
jgi:hypothetical protein